MSFGAAVPRKIANHKCPHCGASYEMGVRRETHRAYHTAVCSYCGDVMAEWHGYARRYRRLSRPRSPATLAKAIVDMAAGNAGQQERRAKAQITARATRRRSNRASA